MSLVAAYGDSDSDSESDTDDSKVPCEISPVVTKEESSKDVDNNDSGKKSPADTSTNLFSILPQPKAKKSELVVEEVDDDFVRKKDFNNEKHVAINPSTEFTDDRLKEGKAPRRNFLNLPKPSKTTEIDKKKLVKISIPTLEEIGADSDSDTEESKADTSKTESKKKSSLFSLLPKPKHSVNVGINKNKVFSRETNRPLVPHTLTKKKEHIKESIQSVKNKKAKSLVNVEHSDTDSDDDDHGANDISSSNFFSLGVDSSNKSNNLDVTGKIPDIISDGNKKIICDESIQEENNSKCTSVHKKESDIILDKKSTQVVSSNTKQNTFFSNLYKSDKMDNRIKTESNKPKSRALMKPENTLLIPESTLLANVENKSDSPAVSSSSVKSADNISLNNVTASYNDVTAPYNDVTAPYNDVTAPYKEVTAPYNDVTTPYKDVTSPYTNVTAPYNTVTAPYNDATAPYNDITAPYNTEAAPYGNVRESHDNKSYPSQPFFSYAYHNYNNAESASEITDGSPVTDGSPEVDYYNKPNEDLPIDKDALKALQGSKRRKEDINLIDVHADDIQANSGDYLKNLTTESMYQSKSSKDQPTSAQKRKHQITYLAFQAKERELQLQQAWSENRATKRQTQGKYGF